MQAKHETDTGRLHSCRGRRRVVFYPVRRTRI